MQAKIEVADRKEADLIRRALDDPATRALVKVMGALSTLPDDRARKRTLRYVEDYSAERA